ncbi:fas-associated death domain protein [Scaptodrosophila lebanonensis]|uniref:Fas-associated death domain protein n=1 Tax=Drosophila lebanonensis TaxID=7225 RepID=A0A6J2T937_DROLE|nr:fas-associated death domain protein [Scaptodrosophila lebanonensis]
MSGAYCYDMLKALALTETVTSSDLDELKIYFEREIGSTRKMDLITTVEQLIDCLERNDNISEQNVEPFRKFASLSDNAKFSEAVENYKCTDNPIVNQYHEQRLSEELERKLRISGSLETCPAISQEQRQQHRQIQQNYVIPCVLTEDKRRAIYKKLMESLGRSWRELGRHLNITEGSMDDIECRFPNDLKSRILQLMQLFEDDECNDPRHRVLLLCRALSECGRNDLRRKVENIMSH